MNENGYDAASLVCLPRHEYARLVAAKAKMDMIEKMIEKMVKNMDSYAAYPVLKLLFTPSEMEEDGE